MRSAIFYRGARTRRGILAMNIDLISESAWTSVIDGTRNVQFEFLALQLFLVNLRNR